MHVYISLNATAFYLLCIAAFIGAFNLPVWCSSFFIASAFPFMIYHVFFGSSIGKGKPYYRVSNRSFVFYIVCSILFFAIIYWKSGLISSNQLVSISFFDAIYFSITTWTTLGYGDFSPPEHLRLITSLQAILGYLGMGVSIFLISLWMQSIKDRAIRYYNSQNN